MVVSSEKVQLCVGDWVKVGLPTWLAAGLWVCVFLSSGPACDHHAVVGTGVEEANLWLDVDHVRGGEGGGEGEGLQEAGQEEEELVLGQVLSKAVPLADQERNAAVVLLEHLLLV